MINIDNDFIIVKASKTDFNEILEFLFNDFLQTEPLNTAVGLKKDEAYDFFAGKFFLLYLRTIK